MGQLISRCFASSPSSAILQQSMEFGSGGAFSRAAMVSTSLYCTLLYVALTMLCMITGRGMQDGGGNWLKAAVMRAVLVGVGIDDAGEFSIFCFECLKKNGSHHNFTTHRFYYLIMIAQIALYRSTQPAKVNGEHNIKQTKADHTGWFCWMAQPALGNITEPVQRRCMCFCQPCLNGKFADCEKRQADTVDGVWFNQPFVNKMTAPMDTVGRSLAECKAQMKSAKANVAEQG